MAQRTTSWWHHSSVGGALVVVLLCVATVTAWNLLTLDTDPSSAAAAAARTEAHRAVVEAAPALPVAPMSRAEDDDQPAPDGQRAGSDGAVVMAAGGRDETTPLTEDGALTDGTRTGDETGAETDDEADDETRGDTRDETGDADELAGTDVGPAAARAGARGPRLARGVARGGVALLRARAADRELAALARTLPRTFSAWVAPLAPGYRVTATFGASGSRWSRTHTGIDLAAPTGTSVVSVSGGTVDEVGWAGAYGNRVTIRHPDGTETWYCHLSHTAVSDGQPVVAGQLIGAVGSTGNSTGPHLHLEVRLSDGAPTDPYEFLAARGVVL